MNIHVKLLLSALLTLTISACGGGGGGGGSEPPTYPEPPADTTPPVITLVGASSLSLEIGDTYEELGATATDDTDGDISSDIVIDSSAVDESSLGDYSVTYNVSDSAGNQAEEKTRIVSVVETASPVDTTPPVITLKGDNPQTINVNTAYAEAGATAEDDIDGDISESIVIDTSNLKTDAVGSYDISYNVSDSAGNQAATVVRVVSVIDPAASATKTSVLTSIVDTIVVPNYKLLSESAEDFAGIDGPLSTYCDSIGTSSENEMHLAAQEAWLTLMRHVQKAELGNFGPGAKNNQALRNNINFHFDDQQLSTCATDVAVVRANDDSSYDVSVTTGNQRSIAATEYLLFNDDLNHTCASNVSSVSAWNELPDLDRKQQRCHLNKLIASDVAANANQIHTDWSSYRDGFLDPGEIGTNFELMTDALFYFEKISKSTKLNGPLGVDGLCPEDNLTCPELLESPFSETTLHNVKTNAEQLLEIFDAGLDDLADETSGNDWSATFKTLISDVINEINVMVAADGYVSLKHFVDQIDTSNDETACANAFNNPDVASEFPACNLAGMMKRITDDLKIEFVTYLGVDLPESTGGDTD